MPKLVVIAKDHRRSAKPATERAIGSRGWSRPWRSSAFSRGPSKIGGRPRSAIQGCSWPPSSCVFLKSIAMVRVHQSFPDDAVLASMTEPSPSKRSGSYGSGRLLPGAASLVVVTALALAERRQPPADPAESSRNDRSSFLPLSTNCSQANCAPGKWLLRYNPSGCHKAWPWLRDRVSAIGILILPPPAHNGARAGALEFPLSCDRHGSRPDSFACLGWRTTRIGFRTLPIRATYRAWCGLRGRQRPLQRLAVVGAGPSGVETGLQLADLRQGAALLELIEPRAPSCCPGPILSTVEQAPPNGPAAPGRCGCAPLPRVLAVEADQHPSWVCQRAADGASSSGGKTGRRWVIWTAG